MKCWRAFVLAVGACAVGCSGAHLPGLGESCTLLCAPGFSCSPDHYCIKSCECDGGALCVSTSLSIGCPQTAVCVVTGNHGEGMCASLCPDLGCPEGEGSCAAAPDGTPVCVGAGYPWVGADAGASQ